MYLKSLILKGFKSFADKSVLSLEPGITAIVGPNGSGKSNISDAVLWVLGERSARNLRGQAMEDIIFSGSAARKAVSVAEVDLVLDNSDQTLPVEFDEVVITRRMYRSGESEYLVNGVVSRRLDVLDILHDTGLGTGTHSIISQGSLDSILQSKPEDRRALIEEAAGVLKHKQRKEKSARKLAAMDNHLLRVRDVAGEVSRQLGPLERKAKRAEAYKEVSAQLASVKLALAVDDLRQLQGQWDAVCAAEKEAAAFVEEHRASVASAEQKVSDFQELMKRESEDTSELARRQRRAANLAERLDSAEMLLRERRRAAVAADGDLRGAIDNARAEGVRLEGELEQAKLSLQQTASALEEAMAQSKELASKKGSLDEASRALQNELDGLTTRLQQCEREADEARRHRELLQESLADGLAHVKLVEARRAELASDLQAAKEAEAAAATARDAAQQTLAGLEERHGAIQQRLTECFTEKEQAQEAHDACRADLAAAQSSVEALEAAIRTHTEEDPALSWLLDNAVDIDSDLKPLSAALKVEGSLESLVEALLGDDLSALAVKDRPAALKIVASLRGAGRPGDVSLVVDEAGSAAEGTLCKAGKPLLDLLEFPPAAEAAVRALLGDVVVVDTVDEAFAALREASEPVRFICRDGCALWPNGKMRIFGCSEGDGEDEGILARERRLDEARRSCASKQGAFDEAAARLTAAEEAYRAVQSESLAVSQELANHRGVCSAAESEYERVAARLSSVKAEAEAIEGQIATARKTVDELRPEMEASDELLERLARDKTELTRQRDEKRDAAAPLRKQAEELAEAYNEMRMTETKYAERKTYAERMVQSRQQSIDGARAEAAEAAEALKAKAVAVGRGSALLDVFGVLATGLSRRTRSLSEALDASESAANSVHADAASARDAARRAHDEYDRASSRMASVQVEKSRLEVQVEAAVATVVHDCRTPLEVAEGLPSLEDRRSAEDERFRLERRIKNMGTINPDAADEYAALKERYDFLAGQLEDIEAARRSLNRIVRVIDNRMKDDFIQTFDEVNANFNEVFSILFPGGSASLSLDDPDNIEGSGVEVTAQPRGKRLTKMTLMSGGEKSLTALALLFAVYKTRTTPFYILDEVEAALDDTNLRRLTAYIDTLRSSTQLIMITHQRRTMEMADVLFGVSMQADGVTRVISQKLERALEHAHEE